MQEQKLRKIYTLGNILRGGFQGEFDSLDTAWIELSSRFLMSFPCITYSPEPLYYDTIDPNGKRFVDMFVCEENQYGIKENVRCKKGWADMSKTIPVDKDKYSSVSSVFFMR